MTSSPTATVVTVPLTRATTPAPSEPMTTGVVKSARSRTVISSRRFRAARFSLTRIQPSGTAGVGQSSTEMGGLDRSGVKTAARKVGSWVDGVGG